MKTEELLALGLTEEQANKVFAMNGADIAREQAKTQKAESERDTAIRERDTAKTDLEDANKEIETLKKSGGDAAEVQKQLDELQKKYEEDTGDLQKQIGDRDYADALKRGLSNLKVKFSCDGSEKNHLSVLKSDEHRLEMKDGELQGLEEYIKSAKEAHPDDFASNKPAPKFASRVGVGGPPAGKESLGAMYAKQFNAQYAQINNTKE